MIELLRTNDLILISRIEFILGEEGFDCFIADQHMSALEGSVGFLPRRIMVASDELAQIRRILREAGLGEELGNG